MRLKLKDLWNSQQVISELDRLILPIKVSYWIGKNTKKIHSEIQAIERQRIKLVEKYGVVQEDKTLKVPEEKVKQFQGEFEEFLETEIEINIVPLSLESFGAVNLSPSCMAALDFIFIDQEKSS